MTEKLSTTISQILDVLESDQFTDDYIVEFLADEFREPKVARCFRLAFIDLDRIKSSAVRKHAKHIPSCVKLSLVNEARIWRDLEPIPKDKAVLAVATPPKAKAKKAPPKPWVPTLEIQSPVGNPMLWGKTYGDGVPLMQISFDISYLPHVCKWLRSLGIKVVNEQTS